MIILAAAIILSLSNSGIIGKANKAKADTDISNAKDLVAMAHADWMLDEAKIKEEDNTITSFGSYAEKKLQEAGYKVGAGEGSYTVTEDGEVYVGLTETARAAIAAGIKVGDVVMYKADAATYTTDGSENTCDPDSYSETDPQPQTVTTNTDITWKYLGVNTNGELEIMANLSTANTVADNTKVTLSGRGGYLNGSAMLNTICEKLYSKGEVGTARSMNIDDINSLLGYIGEKGAYYDNNGDNGNEVKTAEPLRIGEIDKKLGTSIETETTTPDGKELGTYYADYYKINKTSADIKNTENKDLVYNAKNVYWLASPCVDANFYNGNVNFCVRCVNSSYVGASSVYAAEDISNYNVHAVCPVVTLNSNVTLTKDTTAENTWKIN